MKKTTILTSIICIIIIAGFVALIIKGYRMHNAMQDASIYASASEEDNTVQSDIVQPEAPHSEVMEPNNILVENLQPEAKQNVDMISDTSNQDEELTLEEKDRLRAIARAEVTPLYEKNILSKHKEIYNYNNNVIGYIHIDDTVIDAPVLQTLEDYEYYLHRDIDGVPSEPGCIILDADSEIGIGSRTDGYAKGYEPTLVQLVHGHNMKNGTMFGSLLKYQSMDYGVKHSLIIYDSIYEERQYKLICAFYSEIYPEDADVFKYYNINNFASEEEFDYWNENIQELALYMTDENYSYGDEFIVLSTCAYQTENGRFAVVGVRK